MAKDTLDWERGEKKDVSKRVRTDDCSPETKEEKNRGKGKGKIKKKTHISTNANAHANNHSVLGLSLCK